MGWTITHRPKGMSTLEFFRGEFGDGVIDAASPSPAETYIAYRMRDGRVMGIACMTRWWQSDYFNFGYKDMSEDMGPGIANCPKRILDLLSEPPPNEWAQEWRERCRENIKQRRKLGRLKVGDIVVFPHPIEFRSGARLKELQVYSTKPLCFVEPGGHPYILYRVRRDSLRGAYKKEM